MNRPASLPVIVTENLTKVYRDFWGRASVRAVSNMNLQVEPGQVVGLLGPNGSGKTTTIKLLLGLIFPTEGRAMVLGRPAGDRQARRLIGFLPEESYLYRFLNAEQTLHFFGRLFGLSRPERRRRIDKLLELVGLDKRAAKRPIGTYSKGMARRIGLAQALINDPELVILDEPTTGLDPLGVIEMKALIKRFRRLGKTVLLSSHLLADVDAVCDRLVVLSRGSIIEQGLVNELLEMKDVYELHARNVSVETQRRLVEMVESSGAEVLESGHKRARLEDLFKRVIAAQSENRLAQHPEHDSSDGNRT